MQLVFIFGMKVTSHHSFPHDGHHDEHHAQHDAGLQDV